MSVRRSTQIIAVALPLLLAGSAAPALALDPSAPPSEATEQTGQAAATEQAAPPASSEAQTADRGFTIPIEVSGVVDGLAPHETARVEAHSLDVSGQREAVGEAPAGPDGRYLLEGEAAPGAPLLLEVTVWEPGQEEAATTTWYGGGADLAEAEPLRATGSLDGVDVTVSREHVPEAASGSAAAVPAGGARDLSGPGDASVGLAAAEPGGLPSSERDAQRVILALAAAASFAGGLALLRRASEARLGRVSRR